ncbi:ATP-binding cassette domain-containing protein [Kaistia terrae]|uniref:ATP-binding cassette domain-containing protein n=1 Tax=Kaistia terrae TaxID=537017 RepID=A0ABW0PQY2_9HYPH|nr:ATP-binding cassette domain-containing protein [Kaistia terrae]MCX5577677.1 ATP-binding cassette domain-containing protein [Kaistia terrae]
MTTAPLVELENISKAFGGVQAVDNVSLTVSPGEVIGLLGHNGAGKSTLIRILSGAHTADSGRILVGGTEATITSPKDAKAIGIETIYQTLALADNLDAVSNLFLGRERRRFGIFNDRRTMVRETTEICAQINPRFTNLQTPVRNLSGGQRQTIAIARAVYFNARVLIMDEPTAALGPGETAMVKDLIQQLKSKGVGIILISHDIEDVFDLADRMVVMAGGRVVGRLNTHEATREQVLSLIIMGAETKPNPAAARP